MRHKIYWTMPLWGGRQGSHGDCKQRRLSATELQGGKKGLGHLGVPCETGAKRLGRFPRDDGGREQRRVSETGTHHAPPPRSVAAEPPGTPADHEETRAHGGPVVGGGPPQGQPGIERG